MSNCSVEMLREGRVVCFEMPSILGLLDSVVRDCERALHDASGAEVSGVAVVLRELVRNAVVHGNQQRANRLVRGRVESLGEREFVVVVEDEGLGFDYRSIDSYIPEDPRAIKRRGYILIGSIAKSLFFNERGNRVTAWVTADD